MNIKALIMEYHHLHIAICTIFSYIYSVCVFNNDPC
jgi:hypothetical protein